jgi:hypothetical protein
MPDTRMYVMGSAWDNAVIYVGVHSRKLFTGIVVGATEFHHGLWSDSMDSPAYIYRVWMYDLPELNKQVKE